jgi:hypothetical protein
MKNNLQNIISELNGEVYERVAKAMGEKGEIYMPFELHSTGYADTVFFMGINVWDSENNSLYDDDDKEIDLKAAILAEVKKTVAQINCFGF